MTDLTDRQALELALAAEKASLHSYLRWAFLTRAPAGKDIFIRLATDEFEHMRLLEQQIQGLGVSQRRGRERAEGKGKGGKGKERDFCPPPSVLVQATGFWFGVREFSLEGQ